MILNELFQIPLMERYEDRLIALDQWHNDPTIYISFTDLPKIGINPQSEFDTPLGIYAYPLKEMFRFFEDNDIPFAGDRDYIQVLQSNQVTELSSYSASDLTRDVAKLKEKFGQNPRLLQKADSKLHKYFHTKGGWDENDTWKERDAKVEKHIVEMNKSGETFDFMVNNWILEARPATFAGKMWNVTRELSKTISEPLTPNHLDTAAASKKSPMAKPSIIAWNSILRYLGYQAFSDKKGRGIIHGNEPISAVFLTTKAFKHIKTIHNKIKNEEPEEFARLAYMTSIVNHKIYQQQKPGLTTLKTKPDGSFYDPTARTVGFILQEWPDFLYNNTTHLERAGDDFDNTIAVDFSGFMRAILKVDFNRQFPIVMNVLERRDYFDNVDVVDGVLNLEPTRKDMKVFLKVMLADWNVFYLARAIERLKGVGEKESDKMAAKFIVKAMMNGMRCKTSEVKKILSDMHSAVGMTYWNRLIQLCPEDDLFDKDNDWFHDELIDMARKPKI